MGACTQPESSKTIRVAKPTIQRAIIKDTNAKVETEAIVPRVSNN